MFYKLFFTVFFMVSTFIFSDIYTPKTLAERENFNNLKKEKITIGLLDETFFNLSFPKENIISMNETAKIFFKDYMDLNVTFKSISHKNLKDELRLGTIDGVALLPKGDIYDNFVDFSETIFSEDIFVISQNKNINSLNDLENEVIYTGNITTYNKLFDTILENNDISGYLIPVENLDNYKNKLILTGQPYMYKPKYGVKITHSPGITMALNHEFKSLIPFINDALKLKFRKLFLNDVNSIREKLSYDNFYNSLTLEEKEYLKTKPNLKILYENASDSIISYKSKIDGKYKGVAPAIVELLKRLNINFQDVTTNKIKTTDNLKSREFDAMLLSKTQKRNEDFIFSRKIYEINTYVINLDNTSTSSRTVGVLKNSVEEHIVRRSDVDSNIFVFDSFKDMIKALNSGKVGNLLVTNKEEFDSNRYNIIPFETVPINMAFNKENVILRDIINKAFQSCIDFKKIFDNSQLERETEERALHKREKDIRFILISFSLIFIFIILCISTYLYKEHLTKKNLLKDSLTGLPNRFIFDEFCKNENILEGSTFVIDLNNFKNINDSLGHEFGDVILKEFANFLRNIFINSYLFRISGDEFYGFSFEEPKSIINKLKTFKEFCPTLAKHSIDFNIGLNYKKSNVSFNTSFRYSDLAMLETKKIKNSFFKIADKDFMKKMDRETSILSLLKDDIRDIYPIFQPKFCIKTNKIIGAEALARYNSPTLGFIGPFEFIPIAEKYNFIHKIDYKIASDTIIFIKELLKKKLFLDGFKISFNISMKTFKRDDLITIISGLLKHHGVPGKYIEIEITESIFILDMKDLITKLNSLKELGVQISLDDFTAGHSTAGLLPLLPIDIVKFDKSLLDSIEINRKKGEIVYRNLISLVKDLNFKIVSEGVETKEQLMLLKKLNVEYAQGYYFSKPISKEDFILEVKKYDS